MDIVFLLPPAAGSRRRRGVLTPTGAEAPREKSFGSSCSSPHSVEDAGDERREDIDGPRARGAAMRGRATKSDCTARRRPCLAASGAGASGAGRSALDDGSAELRRSKGKSRPFTTRLLGQLVLNSSPNPNNPASSIPPNPSNAHVFSISLVIGLVEIFYRGVLVF